MSEDFIALLGTKGGPAIRSGSAMPTSSLVSINGQHVVIDCGLGVTRGLVDQGMQLKDLSLIIITHLHSDHYLELGPLIHTAWTAGLSRKVQVWGPGQLREYWDAFLISMKADIELRMEDEGRPDLASLVEINTLAEGTFLTENGLTFSALKNAHPPLEETYCISVAGNGHRIVFSGDTAPFPPLADFAKDADMLVHEAMLKPALEALVERVSNGDDRLMKHLLRSHTTAQDAARIARNAGVKCLVLHHLIPSDDPDYGENDWRDAVAGHYDGKLHVGRDGMKISLSPDR